MELGIAELLQQRIGRCQMEGARENTRVTGSNSGLPWEMAREPPAAGAPGKLQRTFLLAGPANLGILLASWGFRG